MRQREERGKQAGLHPNSRRPRRKISGTKSAPPRADGNRLAASIVPRGSAHTAWR